jgi:hypothetical protein
MRENYSHTNTTTITGISLLHCTEYRMVFRRIHFRIDIAIYIKVPGFRSAVVS